jgi:hypothetical protein
MSNEVGIEGLWDSATIAERHAYHVLGSFPANVVASTPGIVLLTIEGDRNGELDNRT